jgi:hypothetical protein
MNIAAYPFSILGEGTKYVSELLSGGDKSNGSRLDF